MGEHPITWNPPPYACGEQDNSTEKDHKPGLNLFTFEEVIGITVFAYIL